MNKKIAFVWNVDGVTLPPDTPPENIRIRSLVSKADENNNYRRVCVCGNGHAFLNNERKSYVTCPTCSQYVDILSYHKQNEYSYQFCDTTALKVMKRVVSLGGNEIAANITVKTDTIAYWDDNAKNFVVNTEVNSCADDFSALMYALVPHIYPFIDNDEHAQSLREFAYAELYAEISKICKGIYPLKNDRQKFLCSIRTRYPDYLEQVILSLPTVARYFAQCKTAEYLSVTNVPLREACKYVLTHEMASADTLKDILRSVIQWSDEEQTDFVGYMLGNIIQFGSYTADYYRKYRNCSRRDSNINALLASSAFKRKKMQSIADDITANGWGLEAMMKMAEIAPPKKN